MKKYTFLVLILFSLLSCNDPDNSKENKTCDFPAGNRNFTWRVDTVGWWPSEMGGVHAFADDDIYISGSLVTKDHQKVNTMLHWNGLIWKQDSLFPENIVGYMLGLSGDNKMIVGCGNWTLNPERASISEFNNQTKKWKGYQFQTLGALKVVWADGNGYFIAAGDNGSVYEKASYEADWVYYQSPTDHHFNVVTGISKNELYFTAYKYGLGGRRTDQIWRRFQGNWQRLFDTSDTTGTAIKTTELFTNVGDIAVYRCQKTDQFFLFVMNDESSVFQSTGMELRFSKTKLSSLGLPFEAMGRSGLKINFFTPSDYWAIGTMFNFYHWNGTNFQKMVIPSLPSPNGVFGYQKKFVKTKTGKLIIPTEIGQFQVYVILQGTPQ